MNSSRDRVQSSECTHFMATGSASSPRYLHQERSGGGIARQLDLEALS